jgi:hypothetical protein
MLSLLTFGSLPLVHGDVGPKPTTTIEVIGLDQSYYFDLLFPVREDKVQVLTEDEIDEEIRYDYYRDDFPDILNGYRDEDGYASYTLYRGIPHSITEVSDHQFLCGYFSPPDDFKIVLVLEETNEIIVSNKIHKTMFYAEYTFDLSSDDLFNDENRDVYQGVVRYLVDDVDGEVVPWKEIIIQIVFAVLLTLVLEMIVLYAFRYNHKKSYFLVVKVNLFTQTILHALLVLFSLIAAFFGFFATLIIGEFLVFVIEILIYRRYLNEKSQVRAMLYGLIANIVSMVLGTMILGYVIGFI